MNAPRNVSYQAYLLESLKDPQEAAAYMDAALELEDPAALLLALQQVATQGIARRGPAPEHA